jgi:glutamate-ammonia-ligase adenylyltransferase
VPFAVLALGKFGGQEMDYFSDLDIVFAYSGEGKTAGGIYASDLYTRLAQSVFRMLGEPGACGKLYETDTRLRPQGMHGPLACSLAFLESYYFGGSAETWERQSLTKLRLVGGDPEFGARVVQRLNEWVYRSGLSPAEMDKVLDMRRRLEETVGPEDIKRGRGGIVDTEFILQIVRLQHGREHPELRQPNEMAALETAERLRLPISEDAPLLRQHYTFLRQLENRLRMATNRSVDELPRNSQELNELAYSMGFGTADGEELRQRCHQVRRQCRSLFDKFIASARSAP